ncbi:MAG: penicillin-binding transpeptidase domain-containing protein [Acidimicrobiales bacterium]
MSKRGHLVLLIALAVVVGSCSSSSTSPPEALPTPTPTPVPLTAPEVASAYVEAWEMNDWSALDTLVFDAAAGAGQTHRLAWEDIDATATRITAEPLVEDGPRASQDLEVKVEIEDLGSWTYTTTLPLVQVAGEWSVEWTSSVIHPGIVDGRELQKTWVWPQRGWIRAWDDTPLRVERPVVVVGVEPQRIVEQEALLVQLEEVVGVDVERAIESLEAPGVQPDWFIPLVTVRAEEYAEISAEVETLEGVVVRSEAARLAPTDEFARQVLGTVGPITSEQLSTWGEPYDNTSIVGRSGLELVYEEELAGTPSGDIRLVDANGDLVSVLETFAGREPLDLVTTLDEQIQAAAETTLDGVAEPAALVAIDTTSGQIRAAVSRPVDEFSRALSGAYPPGSTFKTVTAAAAMAAGLTPSSTVSCPAEVVEGGLLFTNAGGLALGNVSLQSAFAASCNTAFVNVSAGLEYAELDAAAAAFGFNLDYRVGLNTTGGSVPQPVDDAEFAASAIGQGRVTASPLHMATVAAAVDAGEWLEPVLVLSPEREGTSPPAPISSETAEGLRSMMRSAVVNGTGRAVAGAGSDISGKTGSAEFGDDEPPETHAWFIGYRDGLAFAVLVEGGGAGGSVAAPIANEFLAALPG